MRTSNRTSAARHARLIASVVALLLLGGALGPRSAAQGSMPPRVVAIGDIHGGFGAFRGILERAGIIDAGGRWVGGDTTLVQLGDFTDRGPNVRAVMDLLIDLEEQATAAGGRVSVLLGNHETMNMVGDNRDVTPAIYATFSDEQSEVRRQTAYQAFVKYCASHQARRPAPPCLSSQGDWMAAHPPGFVEYLEAFGPEGRYGRWLRTRPAVLRLGDTVFMHAGIRPDRAPRKLEDINKQVLAEIKRADDYRAKMLGRNLILPFFTLSEVLAQARAELPASGGTFRRSGDDPGGGLAAFDHPDTLGLEEFLRINTWALFDGDGPLWFRGFANWSADEGTSQVTKLLRRYGVAHFVVGHTVPVPRRITPRFASAVFLIDSGAGFVQRGRQSKASRNVR